MRTWLFLGASTLLSATVFTGCANLLAPPAPKPMMSYSILLTYGGGADLVSAVVLGAKAWNDGLGYERFRSADPGGVINVRLSNETDLPIAIAAYDQETHTIALNKKLTGGNLAKAALQGFGYANGLGDASQPGSVMVQSIADVPQYPTSLDIYAAKQKLGTATRDDALAFLQQQAGQ